MWYVILCSEGGDITAGPFTTLIEAHMWASHLTYRLAERVEYEFRDKEKELLTDLAKYCRDRPVDVNLNARLN